MTDQISSDFKKICYDIENLSYRKWTIDKIFTNTYPKSYFYASFNDSSIIFLCHRQEYVFALRDNSLNDTGPLKYRDNFIEDEFISGHLKSIFSDKGVHYNFPPTQFLLLRPEDKNDFDEKITDLNLPTKEIDLALSVIKPQTNKYRPFYRHFGEDLFNDLDD